jgi:dTDP-4-amino-4,6-dideoxygalactose transaminase
MHVPIIDLKQRYSEEREDILKIIDDTLSKGHLVLTPEINDFEKDICNFVKSKNCVTLNSGTDALMMSLWAAGIKKGDEVITSPISFVATIGAIIHVGAKPIFADVDEDLNINPDLIEEKISKKTKAIIPVHWTGRICKMDKILNIAKKHNLEVIEDSAQAMGSYYNNKHGGTFGSVGIFSAHPLKNFNAIGDSGFLVTDNDEYAKKINLFKNHGLASRDNVEIFGVNSRMDTINAQILKYRLSKLDSIIERRTKNVSLYSSLLDIDDIIIPECSNNEKNSFVMFITLANQRDKLKEFLDKKNIESLVYYSKPLHKHKAYIDTFPDENFLPKSESIVKKVLALPIHQHLKEEQIHYVCENIKSFYSS